MIRQVAAEALSRIDQLVPSWLPDGRAEGHEWSATNPRRADNHPGSFKVNMRTGAWADFATDDRGGDLVALAAYLRGVGQGEAARQLADELQIDTRENRPAAAPPPPAPADADRLPGVALLPWPDDAPAIDAPRRASRGVPCSGAWVYRDRRGAGLMVITRHDTQPRKTIRPWHLRQLDGRVEWFAKYPEPYADGGRPLYGLDRLAQRPDAPVLVVEGEKSADAAALLLPGYVAITSPGGSKAAGKADWSPLAGRRIVIWPDHDEPGQSYARAVAGLAIAAHAAGVEVVDFDQLIERHGLPLELPAGFDAADWPAGKPCDLAGCLVPFRGPAPGTPAAPPPPPPAPADGGDDEPRTGRKHRLLIASIERFLVERRLVPDALDGWREAGSWRLVAEDAPSLASALAYELRASGAWSMAYVTETLDHIVRLRRAQRRASLLAGVVGRQSTIPGLRAAEQFVRAITGRVDPVDLAVWRHWIWLAKRQMLGMPCEHHLMVVVHGPQGSGKTSALDLVARPLAELALDIDVTYLTDERRVRALAHLALGRWEEMSGSTRADLEALKHQITSPTVAYRPMRSNSTVVLPRTCSFLGTSNIDVQDMVQDTTGARRFYQLTTPARCDWSILNDINPTDLWDCCSEFEDAPIRAVLPQMRDTQAELVHRDAVALWLEDETWGALQVRLADANPDAHQMLSMGYHNPAQGESFDLVSARFRHWCQIVGQPPIGAKAFAARLRQAGFRRIDAHEGGRHIRLWARPVPPSAAIPPSSHHAASA